MFPFLFSAAASDDDDEEIPAEGSGRATATILVNRLDVFAKEGEGQGEVRRGGATRRQEHFFFYLRPGERSIFTCISALISRKGALVFIHVYACSLLVSARSVRPLATLPLRPDDLSEAVRSVGALPQQAFSPRYEFRRQAPVFKFSSNSFLLH
uniref:Secreted protein n=1 Tax=Steinernema glaseri TaxID=37863 RepID=A0A1I8AKU1_9BILA